MPSKASQQLEKLKSEKKLLISLIFALVAVFLWVTISILSIGKTQIVEPGLVELAQPLVPNLDQNVLEDIEKKRYIESDQLTTFPIYVLAEVNSGNYQLIDVVNQSVQDFINEESVELETPNEKLPEQSSPDSAEVELEKEVKELDKEDEIDSSEPIQEEMSL
ncbi:MAG: hypothetical protein XD95_0355 [Microgenomates bacterium 39_7]|nr:MAG: hypothetical protein XD95_0355 [Microgenomates bacterium 39_7]